ncbi:somatostatin receptor type 2-like [Hydractinia symbiolongicarpus]|uniref:somatostatin receptor type 2-like n=1 Tax=Hydractinia symbiolongicarpus TaxID=13093 RepID=UPI00254D411F|nr:somatostatin receptor type 2-like [Hydractinia symbiolongicarpus]
MVLASLLPTYFYIRCILCHQTNFDQFYCLTFQFDKHVNKLTQEEALCTGGLSLPIPLPENKSWEGPYSQCIPAKLNATPKATSRCIPKDITKSSLNTNCSDPLDRSHKYSCVPSSGRWLFYPDTADFSSYTVLILFVALCITCCFFTVILNMLNIFICIKSKDLRTSKTIVYAFHMAVIDLLIGTVQIPLYIATVYNSNYRSFKGEYTMSQHTAKLVNTWFNRLDLLFLVASFTNLAFMSIERCVVVVKPFWHMRAITVTKVILSIPAIWAYTLTVFFLYYYALDEEYLFSLLSGFAVPTFLIVISYTVVIATMRTSRNKVGRDGQVQDLKRKTEQKVTTKLILLIVLFLLSWIPYLVLTFVYVDKIRSSHIDSVLIKSKLRWVKLLSYCHCFYDPILYSLSRPNIQREFRSVFKGERTTSIGASKIKRSMKLATVASTTV